jgi:hypothetical protein
MGTGSILKLLSCPTCRHCEKLDSVEPCRTCSMQTPRWQPNKADLTRVGGSSSASEQSEESEKSCLTCAGCSGGCTPETGAVYCINHGYSRWRRNVAPGDAGNMVSLVNLRCDKCGIYFPNVVRASEGASSPCVGAAHHSFKERAPKAAAHSESKGECPHFYAGGACRLTSPHCARCSYQYLYGRSACAYRALAAERDRLCDRVEERDRTIRTQDQYRQELESQMAAANEALAVAKEEAETGKGAGVE